jgi:hypothetical protein
MVKVWEKLRKMEETGDVNKPTGDLTGFESLIHGKT